MPDAIFDHPRVARVYDPLDPDRSDLDTYVDLADEFEATAVLDVGCGTGTFCSRLAERGIRVLGVDPAGASVAVARTKAGAESVTWVVGTAADVAADASHHHRYDLATMTANVAQVFLEDEGWLANLRAIHACLRPGGYLALGASARVLHRVHLKQLICCMGPKTPDRLAARPPTATETWMKFPGRRHRRWRARIVMQSCVLVGCLTAFNERSS